MTIDTSDDRIKGVLQAARLSEDDAFMLKMCELVEALQAERDQLNDFILERGEMDD
jgi:hypothetical protein